MKQSVILYHDEKWLDKLAVEFTFHYVHVFARCLEPDLMTFLGHLFLACAHNLLLPAKVLWVSFWTWDRLDQS